MIVVHVVLWLLLGLGVWGMLDDLGAITYRRLSTWLVLVLMLTLWPLWLLLVACLYVGGQLQVLWNWSRR